MTPPGRKMKGSDRRRRVAALVARDGAVCRWCGIDLVVGGATEQYRPPSHATIDHVVPLSAGGSNALSNLVLSCEDCNERRGGIHGPGAYRPGTPSRKAAL